MGSSEENVDVEEMIRRWKELRRDKKFHISGGWTEYKNGKPFKHTPQQIVKGILKRPLCRICNADLEKVREDPKKRSINYCSSRCYQEFKELYKIEKKLKAVMMTWSPKKPPIDKSTIRYCLEQGEEWYDYKTK